MLELRIPIKCIRQPAYLVCVVLVRFELAHWEYGIGLMASNDGNTTTINGDNEPFEFITLQRIVYVLANCALHIALNYIISKLCVRFISKAFYAEETNCGNNTKNCVHPKHEQTCTETVRLFFLSNEWNISRQLYAASSTHVPNVRVKEWKKKKRKKALIRTLLRMVGNGILESWTTALLSKRPWTLPN